MKKRIFLSLAMFFFVFIFVLASAAAIANEAVRNRDGPLIIAPETNVTQISVPSAIPDNGSNIRPAEVRAQFVTSSGSDETRNLPVRSMKLPLADSARKSSHLTIGNDGRISYHHRA